MGDSSLFELGSGITRQAGMGPFRDHYGDGRAAQSFLQALKPGYLRSRTSQP